MRKPKIIIKKGESGQFHTVIQSANSKMVLTSETLTTIQKAQENIEAAAKIFDMYRRGEINIQLQIQQNESV